MKILVAGVAGPKTAVVLGAYRGGTSCIAKLLHAAGVPMGLDYDPAEADDYCNYEDDAITGILRSGDWDALASLARERDDLHPLWGFKWPETVFQLAELLPRLCNPHLLIVLRDPLASWQSDQARGGPLTLADCIAHHEALLRIVQQPPCHCAAVSFERVRGNVEQTAKQIMEFLCAC